VALVPRIATAVGVVNGSNVIFETPGDYIPGSLRVWRNGLVNRPTDPDGWVELSGKKFRMNTAPLPGDVIRVYYLAL
jgi:hypothetical protein